MDLKSATLLRASAIWALWVWAVLIKNMATDHTHGIGFRLVHVGLAVISIGFALITWIIVRRQRRLRSRPSSGAEAAPVRRGARLMRIRAGGAARH